MYECQIRTRREASYLKLWSNFNWQRESQTFYWSRSPQRKKKSRDELCLGIRLPGKVSGKPLTYKSMSSNCQVRLEMIHSHVSDFCRITNLYAMSKIYFIFNQRKICHSSLTMVCYQYIQRLLYTIQSSHKQCLSLIVSKM